MHDIRGGYVSCGVVVGRVEPYEEGRYICKKASALMNNTRDYIL